MEPERLLYRRQWRTLNLEQRRQYEREWYANNREKSLEACRKYRRLHPERVRERNRRYRASRIAYAKSHPEACARSTLRCALRRFGLTIDDYDRIAAKQSGGCAICGSVPDPKNRKFTRLRIDHDHATGAFRGLLCDKCNLGIGYLLDSPGVLRAAADYIERHSIS